MKTDFCSLETFPNSLFKGYIHFKTILCHKAALDM